MPEDHVTTLKLSTVEMACQYSLVFGTTSVRPSLGLSVKGPTKTLRRFQVRLQKHKPKASAFQRKT